MQEPTPPVLTPAQERTLALLRRSGDPLVFDAGLVAPSYRCPPRLVGVQRSLRRYPSGAVVAVQLKGRPWVAVLGDMIEGVVVVNRLAPPHADRLRTELWSALGVDVQGEVAKVA